jgi:hypothetical protein
MIMNGLAQSAKHSAPPAATLSCSCLEQCPDNTVPVARYSADGSHKHLVKEPHAADEVVQNHKHTYRAAGQHQHAAHSAHHVLAQAAHALFCMNERQGNITLVLDRRCGIKLAHSSHPSVAQTHHLCIQLYNCTVLPRAWQHVCGSAPPAVTRPCQLSVCGASLYHRTKHHVLRDTWVPRQHSRLIVRHHPTHTAYKQRAQCRATFNCTYQLYTPPAATQTPTLNCCCQRTLRQARCSTSHCSNHTGCLLEGSHLCILIAPPPGRDQTPAAGSTDPMQNLMHSTPQPTCRPGQ